MLICLLAIESSCDDTSIAILKDGKVLANIISTQKIHEKYGGVVPENASRQHMESMIPTLREALAKAQINLTEIQAIAVTRGPGLIGALVVGLAFAKGLSLALNIPLIEVNHLEAHVMSLFLNDRVPPFPFLCLTVSGGHTQLLKVTDHNTMYLLGQTLDDAAGEAFDKIGKLLGLPYPAGHHIDRLAKTGQPLFKFTLAKVAGLNYSFSGLKTSVLYFLQNKLKENKNFITENLNDLCASVQEAIITMLCVTLTKAAKQFHLTHIGIAGGVSANSRLRTKIQSLAEDNHWNIYIPQLEYCTDNAGMIAISAYYKFKKSEFADEKITALARYTISPILQE
ncbi:MAG: tRNA (adenosine(37)-N6)-threonylcarbamoyltransferase complex transferase subunit TsaD [Bacteroidota bacterium]|nr:tRNA (adenosine(37)-N6)-threonylcarbamoyltransferase complex transferase subunit TsaD [Bacteroidota bacterium]